MSAPTRMPPLLHSSRSSSSSFFSTYDPMRMNQEFIQRIKEVAKMVSKQIPPKDNVGKFDCGVSLTTMTDPTVIGPCGHTFSQWTIQEKLYVTTCPMCRTPIESRTPVLLIKTLINEWEQEERIPTLSNYKKENKKLAERYLQIAKDCEEGNEYDEALTAYTQAFLYTNQSENYAALPLLYKKLKEPEKATLAYLYLAIYQLEEGKVEQAITTLNDAQQIAPTPLGLDALLLSLTLSISPSQKQINEALVILIFPKKTTIHNLFVKKV